MGAFHEQSWGLVGLDEATCRSNGELPSRSPQALAPFIHLSLPGPSEGWSQLG